jgi:hypothetical protein
MEASGQLQAMAGLSPEECPPEEVSMLSLLGIKPPFPCRSGHRLVAIPVPKYTDINIKNYEIKSK